jgi:hypothetical protein
MAIALDAQSGLVQNGFAAGGARTWSHTVAGTDRILVVSVALWQDVAGTGTITAMTYNGVAMTKAQGVTQGAMRAEIWYLVNPATGANTVSATVTGNTDDRKFRSASYTGVDQVAGLDASNSAVGGTGNPTVNVTTIADNSWVQDAVAKFGTGAATIGAGQTSLLNNVTGATLGAASYEGPQTPAGAVTMSWTQASANDWVTVAMSFKPVAVTGTTATPGTLALVLATFAPVVQAPRLVEPGVTALTLTTFAPSVTVGARAVPDLIALLLTTFAPTVSATANVTATPGLVALTLARFAPTVTATNNKVADPPTKALALTTFAPTIINPVTVTPPTTALVITRNPPTAVVTLLVVTGTGSLALTTFAPGAFVLRKPPTAYARGTKPTTAYVRSTKATAAYAKEAKPTVAYTKPSKPTVPFTRVTKPLTGYF